MGENICKDIYPIRGQYSKHIKTHTTQKRKKTKNKKQATQVKNEQI